MSVKRNENQNKLQLLCSCIMLICFTGYAVCLIITGEASMWKGIMCMAGILYAAAVMHLAKNGRI